MDRDSRGLLPSQRSRGAALKSLTGVTGQLAYMLFDWDHRGTWGGRIGRIRAGSSWCTGSPVDTGQYTVSRSTNATSLRLCFPQAIHDENKLI